MHSIDIIPRNSQDLLLCQGSLKGLLDSFSFKQFKQTIWYAVENEKLKSIEKVEDGF